MIPPSGSEESSSSDSEDEDEDDACITRSGGRFPFISFTALSAFHKKQGLVVSCWKYCFAMQWTFYVSWIPNIRFQRKYFSFECSCKTEEIFEEFLTTICYRYGGYCGRQLQQHYRANTDDSRYVQLFRRLYLTSLYTQVRTTSPFQWA